MKTKKSTDIIVRLLVIIFSIITILVSYKYVVKDLDIFQSSFYSEHVARVTEILDKNENKLDVGESSTITLDTTITFNCEIIKGDAKGQIVTATQVNNAMTGVDLKEVEPGDKIMIFESDYGETKGWVLMNYYRIDGVIILAGIFFLLILLLARKKGINILVTLVITCAAIFFVFVPSILAGVNIYLSSLLVCLFIIVTTLIILNGVSKKTFATIIGCFSGVIAAGIIALLMDKLLSLTGIVDEHSIYLQLLNTAKPINLRAITFGSIIIGAMGAVMDVAMDISSALYELKQHVRDIGFRDLIKSGMSIGHDIMGTMSNTLILAYIGSSLSCVLLLITYSSSITEMLNKEQLITEMLQAIIGSIGILITIPLTTIVCGVLYKSTDNSDNDNEDENNNNDMNNTKVTDNTLDVVEIKETKEINEIKENNEINEINGSNNIGTNA